MERIMVIGSPGSGKSVFCLRLAEITGLPLHHLDNLYWNADRTTVLKEMFLSKLQAILKEPQWIIDGNYGATMELRMQACDTIFFLDYPVEVCLQGIEERKGKPRPDMPWTEDVGESDPSFTAFVKDYPKESRPKVMALLAQHEEKNIVIFKSREESEKYLHGMRRKKKGL